MFLIIYIHTNVSPIFASKASKLYRLLLMQWQFEIKNTIIRFFQHLSLSMTKKSEIDKQMFIIIRQGAKKQLFEQGKRVKFFKHTLLSPYSIPEKIRRCSLPLMVIWKNRCHLKRHKHQEHWQLQRRHDQHHARNKQMLFAILPKSAGTLELKKLVLCRTCLCISGVMPTLCLGLFQGKIFKRHLKHKKSKRKV